MLGRQERTRAGNRPRTGVALSGAGRNSTQRQKGSGQMTPFNPSPASLSFHFRSTRHEPGHLACRRSRGRRDMLILNFLWPNLAERTAFRKVIQGQPSCWSTTAK